MNENPWIPLLELTQNFNVEDLPELDTEQLMARAYQAKADAEKEISYAQAISEILERKGESPEAQKSLVTIGVWHFECAVELFSKAIRNFERARASGLSKNREREIELQIRLCHDYLTTVAEQKKTARKLLDSGIH